MSVEKSLPERFSASPETLEYSRATGAVAEGLLEKKDDLYAQFDIETATWGLTLWEMEYGLPTDSIKPYEERRSRLRARIRGQGTTTVGMLQNLAESFSNGEVEVEELTGRYKIIIKFVGTAGIPPNMEDLAAAVQEVISAHIEYGFSYTFATHGELEENTHAQLGLMTHGQVRERGAESSEPINAGIEMLTANVAQTPGYGLPLPAKNDNYSIDVVNEVTKAVDTVLIDLRDGKADGGHDHDERYHTKTETDLKNEEIDTALGMLKENIGRFIPLGDVSNAAVTHRNSFRGKNLGTVVTATQKAAIQSGSFDDLWLGDYWIIGGKTWRIADFNYWLNCGDNAVPPNHLVIMPDACLYYDKMNETNITTGGYVGSKMYTEGLAQAKTMIASAFPGIVLSHRELLVNAVANGYPTAGAWYDSTVELPNEIMMYGSHVFAPAGNGTTITYLHTINNSQLALTAAYPRFIKTRESYWLRDVVSAAYFARVSDGGHADCTGASTSIGVRPVFAIG